MNVAAEIDFAGRGLQVCDFAGGVLLGSENGCVLVLCADFLGLPDHGLYGAAGQQDAAFGFEDAPGVFVEGDLRIVFAQAEEREAFVRDSVILEGGESVQGVLIFFVGDPEDAGFLE